MTLVFRSGTTLRSRCGLDQPPTFFQLQRDGLTCPILCHDLLAPGCEQVTPAGKGNLVIAGPVKGVARLPSVVSQIDHRPLVKLVCTGGPPQEDRRDDIVAIREDVGLKMVQGFSATAFAGKRPPSTRCDIPSMASRSAARRSNCGSAEGVGSDRTWPALARRLVGWWLDTDHPLALGHDIGNKTGTGSCGECS